MHLKMVFKIPREQLQGTTENAGVENVAPECRGEQRESNWLGSINVIFALVHTRPYTYV